MSDDSTSRPQLASIEFRDGVLTVRPVGPAVGQREAPIITDDAIRTMNARQQTIKALVIDLSDVAMLSSMGLGMCINLRNRAKTLKAKTILYGLRPDIDRLIRSVKIGRLYRIARSPRELRKLAA